MMSYLNLRGTTHFYFFKTKKGSYLRIEKREIGKREITQRPYSSSPQRIKLKHISGDTVPFMNNAGDTVPLMNNAGVGWYILTRTLQ